jgi:hypothetical protein
MIVARERRAVAGRPRGAGAKKKQSGRGTTEVTTAAGRALERNGEMITVSLLKGLLDGNVTIAKLLFALAEGQIDCEDEAVMRHVYSLAEKLDLEPPWTGSADEAEPERELAERERAG